jgi:hypothetical protein
MAVRGRKRQITTLVVFGLFVATARDAVRRG